MRQFQTVNPVFFSVFGFLMKQFHLRFYSGCERLKNVVSWKRLFNRTRRKIMKNDANDEIRMNEESLPKQQKSSGNGMNEIGGEAGDELAKFKHYYRKMAATIRNLKIGIMILAAALIISLVFTAYIAVREKKNGTAVFAGSNSGIIVTYKMSDNLQEIVKEFKNEEFSASTEMIGGFEYLTISGVVNEKSLKICYQNEFPDAEFNESMMKSFLIYDGNFILMGDSYDINKPENLVPEKVTFTDGSRGILNISYSEGIPDVMSLYNLDGCRKAGTISLQPTLLYYFSLNRTDENNNTAEIGHGGVNYAYSLNEKQFEAIVTGGKNSIILENGLRVEITEDKISFVAYPSVDGTAYLGEYSGEITYAENGFYMDSQSFAAYVPFEYEDYENNGIITPLTAPLDDRIIIVGKNGGKYALPYYENVELANVDYSKVETDEKGRKVYGEESAAGIDVSKFQGEIDWKKVKADGISFAFVRAGYRGYSKGKIVEDEYAADNLKNAAAEGLDTGIYMFTQAVTVEEGIEEALFAIELAEKTGCTGPIVFDTEAYDEPADARGNLISRELRTEITEAFCNKVEEAGYMPVIYANTRWLLLGIDMDRLADRTVWYAYYGDDPVLPYEFAIWQYSSSGTVAGINSAVDENIMFKNVFGGNK